MITWPDRRVATLGRFLPAIAALHNPVIRDGCLWPLHVLSGVDVPDLVALLRFTPPIPNEEAIHVLLSLYSKTTP